MGGSSLFEPFLDINSPQKYTYGALKCNFNPITEKWEYNYKPEPQGGFFNFALYNKFSLENCPSISFHLKGSEPPKPTLPVSSGKKN